MSVANPTNVSVISYPKDNKNSMVQEYSVSIAQRQLDPKTVRSSRSLIWAPSRNHLFNSVNYTAPQLGGTGYEFTSTLGRQSPPTVALTSRSTKTTAPAITTVCKPKWNAAWPRDCSSSAPTRGRTATDKLNRAILAHRRHRQHLCHRGRSGLQPEPRKHW